jgi:hypothetical protein
VGANHHDLIALGDAWDLRRCLSTSVADAVVFTSMRRRTGCFCSADARAGCGAPRSRPASEAPAGRALVRAAASPAKSLASALVCLQDSGDAFVAQELLLAAASSSYRAMT